MRLVLVCFVLAAACRGEPSKPATPAEPAAKTPAEGSDPDAPQDPAKLPPKCSEGGRVWDGKLEGCLYEVERCCYDSPAAACRAAGCPAPDRCQVLESSPAQIACS